MKFFQFPTTIDYSEQRSSADYSRVYFPAAMAQVKKKYKGFEAPVVS